MIFLEALDCIRACEASGGSQEEVLVIRVTLSKEPEKCDLAVTNRETRFNASAAGEQ